MTLIDFQKEVLRTANMGRTPDLAMAVFALGLCGEAAELKEALGSTYDTEVKEAGDVLWYVAALAHALGITAVDLGIESLSDVQSLGYNRYHAAEIIIDSACRVAEMVKKKIGHSKPPDRLKLIAEFQTMITRLATAMDPVGLGDVAAANVAKLKARYPNGWDLTVAAAKPDSDDLAVPPNHFRHGTAHFDAESGEWKPGPV